MSQASRRNNQYTHFQLDPVSPIKEKKRILGTKVVLEKYYLIVVVKETVMTVAVAVRKNQTKGSLDILKPIEK